MSVSGVGATAARTLELACGVLHGVAHEARDWAASGGAAAQADALRRRSVALAGENAAAYTRAIALLSGTEHQHVVVAAETMAAAAAAPSRIAETAADVAELAAEFASAGPADRRADAAGCAALAYGAAEACALLVAVNLTAAAGDERRASAAAAAQRAGRSRTAALDALGNDLL